MPDDPRAADPLANLASARRALETARAGLDTEIRSYPTPISGCDAQFNHLLAERRRVNKALAALGEEIHIPTPRAP